MKKGKKILGTLLTMVLLLSAFGGSTFAVEKTNLCTTFDETAGVFVGEYIGGDIDGTDTLVYDKIPAGYCFAHYVHHMMAREELLGDYIEYVDGELYQCSIPYAVFEAKAKSIADYAGDLKSGDLGIYDSDSDCMIFTQDEFSSSMGHPAYVIGYVEHENEYDIYIQRMQMGYDTLEEMEADFGDVYPDYDREKDVFVDADGYYHLVHRDIFYKLTATYSNDQIYFKSVERLTSVDGISMIKRGQDVPNDTSVSVTKQGCSIKAAHGVFPYGVSLNIENPTSGSLFSNAQKALQDRVEKMLVYEVNATLNNKAIQPNGEVMMQFEIPKSWDADHLAVFYVSPEGEVEKLKSEVDENGTVATIKITHFSTYVLAETKDAAQAAPKTADGSQMACQIGLLLMSGAAIALITHGKKRRIAM